VKNDFLIGLAVGAIAIVFLAIPMANNRIAAIQAKHHAALAEIARVNAEAEAQLQQAATAFAGHLGDVFNKVEVDREVSESIVAGLSADLAATVQRLRDAEAKRRAEVARAANAAGGSACPDPRPRAGLSGADAEFLASEALRADGVVLDYQDCVGYYRGLKLAVQRYFESASKLNQWENTK
jgi:hypothetical protein